MAKKQNTGAKQDEKKQEPTPIDKTGGKQGSSKPGGGTFSKGTGPSTEDNQDAEPYHPSDQDRHEDAAEEERQQQAPQDPQPSPAPIKQTGRPAPIPVSDDDDF